MAKREPRLQPLRIPMHWKVTFNDFHEVDPSQDANGQKYLVEDLFQAVCEDQNVLVDLGWYPDSDADGRFRIVAHRGDFSGEELLRVEARTRQAAVQALEDALWRFHVR